ncbi:MAG: hypothetical protein K8T89_26025 [Planctomycetes bacterium]|nr:hypothetical protein [Planctomycetota bacterium]
MRHLLPIILFLLASTLMVRAADGEIPPAAKVIRAEAMKPNNGPDGRPLPLVAHWHRRSLPLSFQIEMINKGHFVLPWQAFEVGSGKGELGYAADIKKLREWGLPLALITGGQWEASFYTTPEYLEAPAEKTGVGVSAATGKKIKAVSPLSPIEPWNKLGHSWTENDTVKKLASLYPDIPLVLFVSNNEANRMRWYGIDKDKYFVDKYGLDKDDEFKRKVVADGYIERYKAMIQGMRDGLPSDVWKKNSRFIAYNALGPDHFGRPMGSELGGWLKYSHTTKDRIAWEPFAWEGAVPESYDNHWEPEKVSWRVWSCQVEMMNGVLLRQEAFKANPNFWHEVIFWNGDFSDKKNDKINKLKQYAEQGVPYTPEVYAGWVKHNLWVLTPRVAREWRSSADDKDRWWKYFEQIITAIDTIHRDPVLTRFWRKGELVANRARSHPFNDRVPEKFKNVDRWYNLDSSLDPAGEWNLKTELPVMAVARVLGEKGKREWLVYAHATKKDQENVELTIPDYGKVKVNPKLAGNYYWVKESDRSLSEVGK